MNIYTIHPSDAAKVKKNFRTKLYTFIFAYIIRAHMGNINKYTYMYCILYIIYVYYNKKEETRKKNFDKRVAALA